MMYYINKAVKFIAILISLMVCLPLFLLVAVLVYLDSGLPLLHRREVIGLQGKPFTFLKFRTMVPNADEILLQWQRDDNTYYELYKEHTKLKEDPRITRLGKLLRKSSLDELPQLINVLRGDMNLVGPRPLSYSEAETLDRATLDLRNLVKPGITGLWQVNGRQETTFEERIQMDIEYVKSRSLWLDFKILVGTIPTVIRARGAY